MQIGKITAPATRHQDFFTHFVGTLEHNHAATALCGSDSAHQAGGAGADDQGVRVVSRHGGEILKYNAPA